MGDDRSRDGSAVGMRLLAGADRVEAFCDHALELGMGGIDAGIDHRDQHLLALGERVGLRQAKLGEGILPGIAFGVGCLRPVGSWPLLPHVVEEVRLHCENDALPL